MNSARFSASLRSSDIFLDSIGWSGCNTTLLALEHGVPVVTLPGRFMRGRHSSAILTAAGITDTIAKDTDDYVRIAVRLGRDVAWRQELSARMQFGPPRLFGDVSAVRGLEDFLIEAVARCAAEGIQSPAHERYSSPMPGAPGGTSIPLRPKADVAKRHSEQSPA
jgi:predicted O-linked N-acetylglucosamine transferase (SPINDLY family)